jgi:hypothetical protein
LPEVCEGVEKEEESLQAEEVAFAFKGLVACSSNSIFLIFSKNNPARPAAFSHLAY